ncbi:uncharacterized protein JCM15063_000292 [Sporobolomyces koalae]|uniref:uncharacterized protein n=1 Tax=Sporobolomyces koalae TaxID=500713 RepID=UPI0031792D52
MSNPEHPSAPQRVTKRVMSDALANLDAASKRSTLASSATPVPAHTTSKRRKVEVHSTPKLEQLLLASRSRALTAPIPPPSPTYEPNSFDRLLDRLATFKLSTWSPSKPDSLNALECARHGWTNRSARERLECVTCHKGIVLLPPTSSWTTPAGQALEHEYERSVLEGHAHDPACPWKMRPTQRSLYRISTGDTRSKLVEHVSTEAIQLEQGVPQISTDLVLELPTRAREALEGNNHKLVESISKRSPATSISSSSILLATFGWSLHPRATTGPSLTRSSSSSSISSTTSAAPLLHCHYCLRKVPLTSYLGNSKPFNPATQHHAYCPYVSTSSNTPTSRDSNQRVERIEKKPGFQTRLETLLKPAYSFEHPPFQPRHTNLENVGGGGIQAELDTVKTREVLNYVRKLLGPKPKKG